MFTELCQAIKRVKMDPKSQQLLDEEDLQAMRLDAIYLTAAIMDCLAILIDTANQSGTQCGLVAAKVIAVGRIFNPADFQKSMNLVHRKLEFYASATTFASFTLQANAAGARDEKDILQWILARKRPLYQTDE